MTGEKIFQISSNLPLNIIDLEKFRPLTMSGSAIFRSILLDQQYLPGKANTRKMPKYVVKELRQHAKSKVSESHLHAIEVRKQDSSKSTTKPKPIDHDPLNKHRDESRVMQLKRKLAERKVEKEPGQEEEEEPGLNPCYQSTMGFCCDNVVHRVLRWAGLAHHIVLFDFEWIDEEALMLLRPDDFALMGVSAKDAAAIMEARVKFFGVFYCVLSEAPFYYSFASHAL